MGSQVIPCVLPPLGPLYEGQGMETPLGMYHEGGLIILLVRILYHPQKVLRPSRYGIKPGPQKPKPAVPLPELPPTPPQNSAPLSNLILMGPLTL